MQIEIQNKQQHQLHSAFKRYNFTDAFNRYT